MNRQPKAVISGSFRKHLGEIGLVLDAFQRSGVEVLAPRNIASSGSREGFVFLSSDDPHKSADILESEFMENIKRADFLYMANIGGYIGQSAATEICVAILEGVPIWFAEEIRQVSDEIPKSVQKIISKSMFRLLPIDGITSEAVSDIALFNIAPSDFAPLVLVEEERGLLAKAIDDLLKSLKSVTIPSMSNLHLKPSPTLADFQKYIADMVKERGFDKESISEIFMLFLEECGELAKAARKTQNIHTDKNSEIFKLEQEAADVFIYLLDICNHFNIDLEKAFRDKEEINKQRTWEKPAQ